MPLVLAVVDVGSSCGRRMLVGPVYLASALLLAGKLGALEVRMLDVPILGVRV